MQNHYVPGIAQFARIFEEPLSQPAYDLEDFLDMNYDQVKKGFADLLKIFFLNPFSPSS